MGDKLANCRVGINALSAATPCTRLVDASLFYKTEPMDFKDQDWFINAVVRIETDLSPSGLLKTLKGIQENAGRKQGQIRIGPRILDLDIIFYDDLVMEADGLTIPHPRMQERRFVLKPLCDINPDIVHPVMGKKVRVLMDHLDENEGKVVELP
jgi:2-amino-4-hydroxy-6-hydroxymethyldihydropteridine diphosphokinase